MKTIALIIVWVVSAAGLCAYAADCGRRDREDGVPRPCHFYVPPQMRWGFSVTPQGHPHWGWRWSRSP